MKKYNLTNQINRIVSTILLLLGLKQEHVGLGSVKKIALINFNTRNAFGIYSFKAALVFSALLLSGVGFAQSTANYAFTTNATGSLALDANGNAVDLTTGTTSLVAAASDQGVSAVTNIGFNFIFMGNSFSQFSVSANGILQLGSTAVATTTYVASGGSVSVPRFSALSADAITASAVDGGGVTSKIVGSAPNRCLVVQWVSYLYWLNTAAPATFQVRLYEATGVVEYVYGAMPVGATAYSSGYQTGFSVGTTSNTLASITTSTNGNSTTTFATNSYTASTNIANLHSTSNGSRRVYTFTPPSTASAAPTTLTFTAVTASTITPNWVDNSTDEVGFLVTRAVDAGFTTGVVSTFVATTTSVTTGTPYTLAQTALSAGTTYFYRVQAVREGTASTALAGSQATAAGTTYYWVGATNGTWGTAANWDTNPAGGGSIRTTPATTDILIIDGEGFVAGGNLTISHNVATQSIGQFKVTSNTNLTLQSDSATTRTTTITGGGGDDLVVESGSTLNLVSASNAAAFAFSGTGNTGLIAGTYNTSGSTSNVITTTGGTSTLVTVTGSVNNNIAGASGCLLGSTTTLAFGASSNYLHGSFTTTSGFIPLATWDTTSTVTITGGTTATAITNPTQSFGNFVYNAAASSGTMSFWTSGTTAVVKGNLTITSTGTGIFRALTTGTVNINGNVIVNGGTLQSASSTGAFIANGITTVNSGGILDVNAGTYSQRGNSFTNNGAISSTAGTLQIVNFTGSAAQTLAGSGTVTGNFSAINIQNTAGLTIAHAAQIPTLRVNLFQGTITGSGKITIGTGAALATVVQIGSAGLTTPGGSFDVAPTFNLGTGTYALLYAQESVARTTGFEIPSSRSISALTLSNSNGLTLAGGGLATGTLTFSALSGGNITTTTANLLTVTGTTTGSIVRTLATAYVNGPLALTLPASLVTGSTYTFPIGKGSLNTFALVNPTTNAGGTVTVQAEAFDGDAGGTLGTNIGAISSTKYWAASVTNGAANFTDALIQLNDTTTGRDAIAASATVNGAYNLQGGVSVTTTGTTLTTTAPKNTTLPGFFLMGNKAAANLASLAISPTGNQCTNVTRTVTVQVTPGGAAVTGVVINYTVNGVAQSAVSMSNTTGNGGFAMDIWSGVLPTVTPANAAITWSVTATDANTLTRTINGTGYQDAPLTGFTASATASLTTVCAGSSTVLSATLTGTVATASVGAGATTTTAVSTVFNGGYGGLKAQMLYTKDELLLAGLRAGPITSFALDVSAVGTTYNGFGISMGATSLTALTSNIETGLTSVYSVASVTPVLNVNTYPTSGFTWDGNSNIIVSICWSNVNTSNTATTLRADNTTNVSCVTYRKDSETAANLCSFTGATGAGTFSYSTGSVRPRAIFGGTAVSVITPSLITWNDGTSDVGTGNNLSVAPSNTKTYTPTLTFSGCTIAATGIAVTVNPLPTAPTVSNNNTQCGTAVPSAILADPNGFTTPTYKWYANNSTTTALQSTTAVTYAATVESTTTLYATVVNPTTGCESARTPITITVDAPSATTITNNGSASICPNVTNAVNLTANGYATATWTVSPNTGAGGFSGSFVGTNLLTTPTAAGTYTYSVSTTDGTCTSTANIVITVNALPVVSISPTTPTICAGNPVTLTASSSIISSGPTGLPATYCTADSSGGGGANPITSVSFNDLNHTTVSQVSPYYTIYPAIGANTTTVTAGQTYPLTVTSGTATIASVWIDYNRNGVYEASEWQQIWTSATSGTINITIPANAVAGSTGLRIRTRGTGNTNTSTDACTAFFSGTSEDYTINILGSVDVSGSLTWTWDAPGAVSNVLTVSPATTTTYTATGLNTTTGCSTSVSRTVTVNPLPAAPSVTDSAQCGTKVPTASVADTNGFTTPTFKWYANNSTTTALQTSTSATFTSSINTTTTFWVSVVNPTTTCESTRAQVTVTVTAPDAITITPSASTTVCLGGSVNLGASSTAAYTYTWAASPSTGAGISGSGASISVTPTAVGTFTYTVTGTDSGSGCTTTQNVVVTVNAVPTITASASPTTVCNGGISTLTAGEPFGANNYVFSSTSGGALDSMVGATSLLASGIDNTASALTTFPDSFVFKLEGVNYSNFTVSDNGVLKLGAVVSTTQYGSVISANLLSVLGQDMGTGSDGSVVYVITGTAPNRIFKVQWMTTHTWSTTNPINNTYQMWLYEDGRIQYLYGNLASSGTPSAGIGVCGTNTANYRSVAVSSGTVSSTSVTSNSTLPSSGTVYTFTPPVQSPITWSPITDLYTDSAATIPYTALTNASIVYAKPSTNGLNNYTATATLASNSCTASQVVGVTVNALPSTLTAINASQCGAGIPTGATVSDTNGFTSPTYKIYLDNNPATAAVQANTTKYFNSSISATTTFYISVVNPSTGCESTRTAVTATVDTLPAATISYANTPFCSTTTTGTGVTFSGTSGGTYSASPAGLAINASTGTIDPTTSTAGTYTVTYTMDGLACGIQTATTPVTINAAPNAAFTYSASNYCTSGGSVLPTLTGTAGTFTSTPAGLSLNATTGEIDLTTSDAGTYNITNTVSAGGCADNVVTYTGLTITTAVAISSQPTTVSKLPGQTASFTVVASGSGTLTYQWQINTGSGWSNLSDAGVYSNTNSATLDISDVTGLDGYLYHVIVSGTAPCSPLTSSNATLTVNSIAFSTQPASQTICSTGSVTFTVATSGGVPTTYNWQYRANSSGTFANISGANTDTYSIASGLTSANTGNQYRCVVDQATSNPVTSAIATVTVNDLPAFSASLASQTVCTSAASVTFAANATGTDLSYQWQLSTNAGADWSDVASANAATYVINAPTTALSGNQYRVIVTGQAPAPCDTPITSAAATLTVNQAVAIGTNPIAQVLCPSATANFSISGVTGTGVTYQWFATNGTPVSLTNGATGSGATVSGANSATLAITTPLEFNNYSFYCVVSGVAPCSSATSTSALLTLYNKAVYSIGAGGDFTNLTTAVAQLQSCGITQATTLALNANYNGANEPAYPVVLPSISGASAVNTITIREATGVTGKVISNATVTPSAVATIDMNAGKYWIIDGRVGGTGTTKDLQVTNSNTSGAAIRFINDASNNTVTYVDVSGVNSTTTGGVVFFSTGATTGNDFNNVNNCNIRNAATNPVNGVYSAGTALMLNDNNTIANNAIYDFFSATAATNGINVATNSGAWTISGNRLYQTATRVYTTANTHNGINIATGDGYTVSGNIIGFANATGTGTTNLVGNTVTLSGFPAAYATTGTANATRYIAINAAFTAAGTVSNIQSNTIAGFALYTSSGATSANGVFCGINVTSGNANIGTTTGNTIGATSGNSSIYVAATTTGAQVVGIFATSANTVAIQNNTIGAIDAAGTSATLRSGITGIDTAGAGNFSITNNFIGNADATNLRSGHFLSGANLTNNNGTSTSTTGATAFLMGIRSTMTGNVLAISGNTLRGWSTSGTVTPVTGIFTSGTLTGTTPTLDINTNSLGTASRNFMTYDFANSGALAGISSSSVATTSNVNGNDVRGIVHSVAGSSVHTYISYTGGTAANNVSSISNNTFTNLNVNTTGSVTFLTNSYLVAATGTQTINANSIVTAFNKPSAGGTITLDTSSSSSVAGAVINHTNNNFSNITVTGATTIAGWISTDGGTANKTYSGNTFSNWTGGSSAITGMSVSFGGGNGGNGNVLSTNTISNITGSGIITGITLGGSGTTHTASSNTITGLSSTGTGGAVTGIASSAPTGNIFSNTINTLSSTSTTATVAGITSSGTTANIYSNIINGLSSVASTSGGTNGISVSAGTTVRVYKNKVYDLSASGVFTTLGAVNGILLSGGTTVTAYNNLVGDLKATAANSADAIRGISVTATGTSTSYNLYNNTIYLNASSSGAAFGTAGIFHAASATATTAKLDVQNNIVINTSTPGTTGVITALRRSAAATLGNFATTSNRNMYFAGAAAANRTILFDGTNAYQTYGDFFTAVGPTREANSFVDTAFSAPAFFTSTTGSGATYLQPNSGITTLAESGGNNLSGVFTDDYNGLTRPVTPGTSFDLGAWEFAGQTTAPVITFTSITPATSQCTATARTVVAAVTSSGGTISSVTLNYSYNGTAQTPVTMALGTGNSYSGVIPAPTSPANAAVTWSIAAVNSAALNSTYTGTAYSDAPLTGVVANAVATLTTVCAASPTVLSADFNKYTNSFEAGISDFTSATVTTGTPSLTQNATYFSEGTKSMYLNTASLSAEVSANLNSNINLNGMSTAVLTFSHIALMEGTSTAYDYGYVEYSTNGGTSWTTFPTTSYTGSASATVFTGGNARFTSLSYTDWVSAGNPGTPSNSIWKNETFTIPAAALTSSQFRVRFRYTTDSSTNYYGWLIDNVKILSSTAPITNISWATTAAPGTEIGTGNNLSVSPTATTSYVATLTASGCTIATSPVTVTVNPILTPSVSIAATATSICPGSSVTFTATPTNGGTPSYQWKVNGVNAGTNSPTFATATLVNNDAVTVVMTSTASPCLGTPTATSNTIVITVTAIPTLVITNPAGITAPATANLTAPAVTAGSTAGLTFGYFTDAAGTIAVADATAVGVGTYYIKGTSAAGCSSAIASVTVSSSITTYYSTGWTFGLPNSSMDAIIADPFTSTGNLAALTLTVNTGASITVASGTTLTVVNEITNNAGVTGIVVENNGVLLQTSTAPNGAETALATVYRNSSNLYRQDYTLWSSPVSGQNLRAFSTMTLFNRFFSYNTAGGTNGVYAQELFTASDVADKKFVNAKGYLIRMPSDWPEFANVGTPGTPYIGIFRGTLNNGTISIPLSIANTGYNLVGNPYPSPISISAFFAGNSGIQQTLYFWRKRNGVPGSGYATTTGLGLASAQSEVQGLDMQNTIKPGQGFFVKSTGSTNLTFTNAMRTNTAATPFLRTANTTELHRLWLNLSTATDVVGQTLIGYTTGASQGFDDGIDAPYFNDSPLALTSLIGGNEHIIQGRSVPFATTDVVPLGFKSDVANNFTISLSNFDGLFSGSQDIFLKDNLTGALQNLKLGDYTFSSAIGVFNTRFEVQFINTLGTDNPGSVSTKILVAVKDQVIKINAADVMIKKVDLVDVTGRVIYTQDDVNATTAIIENILATNQMLIVRITTQSNGVLNQKIIY